MPKRVLWAIGLALLVAAGSGGAVAAVRRLPVAVLAATVDRGDVIRTVSGIATIESQTEIPLGFEVAGRITTLAVHEGDRVQAGQPLGTLDTTDLQRQLAVAEANYAVASAAVSRSRAERERAIATRARSAQDHARKASLSEAGAISPADQDAATERLAVSQAELKALEAALAQSGKAQVAAERQIAVQQAAVAHARLTAPMDGLVVRRQREPGQVVTPGMPVLTIVSTRKLWARTWIDESALGSLVPGQRAAIHFYSVPDRSYPGQIDRLGQQVDRQTHELLVDVTVLERPAQLALGQRADVAITTARQSGVVRVPLPFVDLTTGTVHAVRDGRTVRVQVGLGLIGTTHAEIRRGLDVGEQIVRAAKPGTELPAGRRVRIEAPV
jgi:RND family efflux transporter MFP subunit